MVRCRRARRVGAGFEGAETTSREVVHSSERCRSLAPGEVVEVFSTQAQRCPSARVPRRVQRVQEVVDKALTQRVVVHEEEVAEGERRLVEAAQPEPFGITSVTKLQQQIDALVRERDALRAYLHQEES